MSKDRLEAFSDGVFAIILTLLVLELRAPAIPAHSSLGQYAVAMTPLIPKFVSFLLTFVTICIHWVSHHYFFLTLRRITIQLVWLNNLFLLWICFLPFPTAMLGNNLTDQFPILLYSVDSLLCALTFYAFRSYASRAQLFEPEEAGALGPRRSIPAIAIYVLAILLTFVNVYLALLCFLAIPLFYFVPTMMIRGGGKLSAISSARADDIRDVRLTLTRLISGQLRDKSLNTKVTKDFKGEEEG